MISGAFQISGFRYLAQETDAKKMGADGKPTEETVRLKVLQFQDMHNGTMFNFTFSVEEFEQFLNTISGKSILEASFLPPVTHLPPRGMINRRN